MVTANPCGKTTPAAASSKDTYDFKAKYLKTCIHLFCYTTTFFHSGVPQGVDPACSRRMDVRTGLAGDRAAAAGGGLRTDAILMLVVAESLACERKIKFLN
jgi:hypothetical protein